MVVVSTTVPIGMTAKFPLFAFPVNINMNGNVAPAAPVVPSVLFSSKNLVLFYPSLLMFVMPVLNVKTVHLPNIFTLLMRLRSAMRALPYFQIRLRFISRGHCSP